MATATTGGAPAATPPLPKLSPLSALLQEWETDAEAAHDAYVTGRPRGPISGLKKLDLELGGLLSPGLHVLHASPGVGKTALGLQIAADCSCPALYLSCEMSPLELFRRITARATRTFLGRLKSGELDPLSSLDLARRAAGAAPGLALADATLAWAPPDWLQQAAEATRGTFPHALIVVDSLHSWVESNPQNLAEYEAINAGLTALRKVSSDLACPVLIIAERNRAAMTSGGMSASAGSRKFEYGGESVLELNRDPKDQPDAAGEVPVELRITKNRNGAPGHCIKLLFHGALQSYREA